MVTMAQYTYDRRARCIGFPSQRKTAPACRRFTTTMLQPSLQNRRSCQPLVAVWLSRDPIDEKGFVAERIEDKDVEVLKTILTSSGETRRWVIKNPSFMKQSEDFKNQLDLKRSKASSQSVLHPYNFVGNNPVGEIDKFGLDRWVGAFGHAWIIVQTWDANGNSTGYLKIEFGPCHCKWSTYLSAFLYAPGEVTISTASGPPSILTEVSQTTSTASQDQALIDWANQLQAANGTADADIYNALRANCRNFASFGATVGMGTP